MRLTGVAIALLLAPSFAPLAVGENCPPNAIHCQLVVEIGQTVTVVVELGMTVVGGLTGGAALFQAEPNAEVEIWANVYVSAAGGIATIDIEFDESAGVSFPDGNEESVAATTTAQNITFPIEFDEDFAEGDVAFVPVEIAHEDGSLAATHIPIQVGAVEGSSLWDWWWLFALVLLVGAAIGAFVARVL